MDSLRSEQLFAGQALVLFQGKAVGHARDVVGTGTRQVGRGGVLGRKQARVTDIEAEQVAQHLLGPQARALHLRMAVKVGKQEAFQLGAGRAHRRTEAQQRRQRAPRVASMMSYTRADSMRPMVSNSSRLPVKAGCSARASSRYWHTSGTARNCSSSSRPERTPSSMSWAL